MYLGIRRFLEEGDFQGLTIHFDEFGADGRFTQLPMLAASYEVASALGTVGLTMGVTPELGAGSRLLVAFLMFLGRVGILSLSLAFLTRKGGADKLRWPETNILVG